MDRPAPNYQLTLYVTGSTVRSARAIANLRDFCDSEFADDYGLEVVDLYQSPHRALAGQIVAAPTLVRTSPRPERRVIGDMSDRRRLREAVRVA